MSARRAITRRINRFHWMRWRNARFRLRSFTPIGTRAGPRKSSGLNDRRSTGKSRPTICEKSSESSFRGESRLIVFGEENHHGMLELAAFGFAPTIGKRMQDRFALLLAH